MGAAAYNRGSRRVSMEADERMPVALSRAAQQAHKDEVALLREQIATLNRDLRRARRCLNSERAGREALRVRLAHEERANAFSVGILCRLAFPGATNAKDLDVEDVRRIARDLNAWLAEADRG